MDRRQARGPGVSRLLVLCAVLFGLFLMHGAPATAAEGCHGAMSAPTGMHEARAATRTSAEPSVAHSDVQRALGTSVMDRETCVSTPARDGKPLPMGGLAAVFTAFAGVFLVCWSAAAGWAGRRGPPPPGGRSLLLQVCIART
ncbi:hypothetical protein [Streptomyces sp. HUAS TT7]|uniref:hypothetical protein n=1 Tax=Streptomyces sp. HUAS TT7 TaxID=3447507 RepID=UPI003F659E1C